MAKKKQAKKKDETMRSLDDPWVPSSELPPEPIHPKKPRKPRKKSYIKSAQPSFSTNNVSTPVNAAAITFDEHCKLIKQKEDEIEVLLESHASILGMTSALFSFSLAMIIGAFIGLFSNFFHGIVGIVIFGLAACSIFFITKTCFPKKYNDWNEFKAKIKK